MRQQLRALTAVLCILCTAGCTSTELLSWKRWKKPDVPKADENNPAVRIVALWEPSEGIGLDKLPTRGFAGQILFFTKGGASPVAVDGKVRIYLYDDDGPAQTRGRPIHQFDFPSESWHAHLLQGMLGPSYHVFIPYTRKDGYRARCSLRVRLTPEHGPVIYSELVHVTLPGPTREGESQNLSQSGKAAVPELLDQPADNKPLGASVAKYRLPLRRVANVSSRGVGQQADLNPGRDPVRPADGTAGRPRLAENNRPQFRHENRIESRSPAGSLRPHATAEHREPALRNEPRAGTTM